MASGRDRISATQRFSHATWAGVIAFVLAISTLLAPIDQFTWVIQSRLAEFDASGDIVYIGASESIDDPDFPGRRLELANTLTALREAGVKRVYVDLPLDRPADPAVDARLNAALRAFNGDAFLVRNVSAGLNGELRLDTPTAEIRRGVPAVGTRRYQNYMGFVWDVPLVVDDGHERLPSLPASIAAVSSGQSEFQINYGFDLRTIPSYRFRDLQSATGPFGAQGGGLPEGLAGKIVVIGNARAAHQGTTNIPGHLDVAPSMIDIYAAETLLAGYHNVTQNWVVVLMALAMLCLVAQLRGRRLRYAGYALLVAGLPLMVVLSSKMAIATSISGALVLIGTYGALRLRAKWQSSLRMVDPDTGLPTFAALEADKAVSETVPTIIVARIHRFEEVKRTLPRELHAEYLLRLIARLKAAKQDATIYAGPGHLIAWTFPEKEPALIREHLEGLRALFSAPLLVGDHQVDVRITFGVDITPSPNVTRRLAAAVDAAEHTTETYEPIVIAETASDEDLIWNISLQARIDAALSNGEIYMIYQPKVLVQTGEIIGVEALVRWRDPVKGLIPPDHFIRQCENAGRMSHLTRHALRESCRAGNVFAENGLPIPVAVNISSTLVHEPQIVTMVREVLQETGFDPRRLVLEITETYRISNFDRAAEVLGDLAALGPKISMDDFGVGAASLEALQRLPFGELKIDRTFIAAMKDDPKACAIVRSVLQLGKDLRITVVAEGVENGATLLLLRDSGCQVAQGFGISRPIALEEVLRFQPLNPEERLRDMV